MFAYMKGLIYILYNQTNVINDKNRNMYPFRVTFLCITLFKLEM